MHLCSLPPPSTCLTACQVSSLQLDELELASLRGLVDSVSVSLNFEKRRGSGRVAVRQPRFSGLQAQSLDAAARWTGDVVSGGGRWKMGGARGREV